MHIHMYVAVLACACTYEGQKSMSDSKFSYIRSLTNPRTHGFSLTGCLTSTWDSSLSSPLGGVTDIHH